MARMRRIFALAAGSAIAGAALFWWLSAPARAPASVLAAVSGDAARGEAIFHAAGCASCHAAPGAKGEARLVLSGGRRFPSPFGTFTAPNISPHPQAGIGTWSALDLYNALHHGTSPDGRHYYPAFPYTTYIRMTPQDAADLHAWLMRLPPSPKASAPHDLPFPFTIRRGLGLWKRLYLSPEWIVTGDLSPEEARGRYLVEALGHCGECHTPRNALGGLEKARWLGGAPNPAGKGRIPDITPGGLDWSKADIAYYLETGFTPDFDSAGGEMAEVVENLSHLPKSDLMAIAAYLKRVPPVKSGKKSAQE